MSGMLKWVCSFLPGSEVTIGNVASSKVQCGEEKLLCSIELTDPKASFTTYHTNEIKVSCQDGSIFKKGECEISIRKISARIIRVYCLPKRSGKVNVQLDLGKWYTFKGKSQLPVVFLPSCPAKLINITVGGSNYVSQDIEITLDAVDRFENKASVCKHDIKVTSDPEGAVSLVDSDMSSGKYTLHVRCHIKCEAKILIALKFPGLQFDNERCHQINPNIFTDFLFDIHHAPISWDCINATVVSPANDRVIAGSPFTVKVKIDNVFGAPAHRDLVHSISAITSQNRVLESRLTPEIIQGYLLEIIQTEAGRHSLGILLNGKLTQNSNRHLNIHVLPSNPTTLRCVKAACTLPNESEFKPEENALYYGAWSTIQVDVTDEYGNVCNQIRDDDYEVHLKATNNKGIPVALRWRNMKIVNGKLCVHVLPKEMGQLQLVVLLKDKRNPDKESTPLITKINVLDPPCSLSQSKIKFDGDGVFVAGSEYKFELHIYDVFGNPVRKTSTAQCNITARIMPKYSRFRKGCHENLKKNIVSESEDVCLTWTLTMEKAGPRQVELAMHDIQEEYVNVRKVPIQVIPSDPHALTELLFKVKTSMDPNFTSDANSLYNDQWSTLEAVVLDKYNNVVTQLDGNCNIQFNAKAEDQGNEIEVMCKDATIKDGRLRLQVKGKGVGKQDFLPTLTTNFKERPNEKYYLQPVYLQVIDAPISLTLAKLEKPDSCVAGSECKFQLHLYDVFGKPVPQTSTAQNSIDAQIIPEEHKENIKMEIDSKSAYSCLTAMLALEEAGSSQVEVIIRNSKYVDIRKVSIQVIPSNPHALWKLQFKAKTSKDPNFTGDANSVYNDQWSSLEAIVLDKYNNVVTQLDGDCNIQFNAKAEDQRNEIEVMCKDATIKVGRLRLQVKGKDVGKQDFLPRLTNNYKERPNEKYDLQPVHLQVIDAPISLTLSELEKPDSCVAGSECKFQLHLHDVFDKPVPQTSTAQNNIDAQIIPEGRNGNLDEERIACKKVAKSSSCFVDVSFLLTKAGERHFEIFDNENNSKRQLSLKVEPDVSNVHWELVNNREKTYKKEDLTLTAQLLDPFGNEVNVDPLSQVELHLLSGPEDRLEYETASISGSTISIPYHFTKKGNYVVSLQCHGSESKTFSIIVEDAPVDPVSSSVTWVPSYEDQPLFPDDKSLLCRVILKDVHGDNYEGDVGGENLTVKCGEMQAEIMDIQRDDSGSFKIEVSLEELTMENGEQEFWFAFNGEEITRPLDLEFDGVQEYDDELVTMESRIHGVIHCRDVMKEEIIGPDYSHLNNIKRVCELEDDPEIEECIDDDEEDEYISIKLSDYENNNMTRRMFYKTLLHLLKALYYRQQAFEADEERQHWKEMATESYDMNNSVENPDWSRPTLFSRIKEKYATMMNEYHEKACDEFFTFFNTKRSQSEIDLHGLLVADEKKLTKYERQLQEKHSNAETKAKVKKEREKGDEAIRKLKERLDGYDIKKAREDKETWLEIIVGSGHHSKDRQVIRPKVEKYLRERNLEFKPVNKGALVVTYEKYKGRDPCFGEYYCKKCGNRWRNRRSWKEKWQACYKCYDQNNRIVECLPLKQRQDRKWLPYKPTGARTSEVIPHLPELCQKCKELGRECPLRSTEETIYD